MSIAALKPSLQVEFPAPHPVVISNSTGKIALSDLEKSVVRLSRHDPLSSILHQSRFHQRLDRLIGHKQPNELADPRFEALRKVAVTLRHGLSPEGHKLDEFYAVGYTREHADLVRQMLRKEPYPAPRDDRREGVLIFLPLVAVAIFALVWWQAQDVNIGIIARALVFATMGALTMQNGDQDH